MKAFGHENEVSKTACFKFDEVSFDWREHEHWNELRALNAFGALFRVSMEIPATSHKGKPDLRSEVATACSENLRDSQVFIPVPHLNKILDCMYIYIPTPC